MMTMYASRTTDAYTWSVLSMPEVECLTCSKKFHKSPSKARRVDRHFCCNKCKHKYYKKHGKEMMRKQERTDLSR